MRSTKARSREAGSRPQQSMAACRRADLLALTKLHYNTCSFGDGIPVTSRFADAVGAILTAAQRKNEPPPLPLRDYICRACVARAASKFTPRFTPDTASNKTGQPLVRANPLIRLVGTAGFELATPCTPCKCATRLRYAPTEREL